MVFRLKEIRQQRGITQTKLSELSGISRQVIIKMEKDTEGKSTAHTLIELARVLQVEPGDLFYPLWHQ